MEASSADGSGTCIEENSAAERAETSEETSGAEQGRKKRKASQPSKTHAKKKKLEIRKPNEALQNDSGVVARKKGPSKAELFRPIPKAEFDEGLVNGSLEENSVTYGDVNKLY